MSVVRFISDLHVGHANMISKRGFSNIEYHDENIIEQWNMTVNKRDVTYILGDLTMEKANYEFLSKLAGIKYIIGGNHDKPNHTSEILRYVSRFAGIIKYKSKSYPNTVFWLTHCPIHPLELDMYNNKGIQAYNIHGHIHDGYKIEDYRYKNVCAENINYKPKTIEELL